MLAALNVERQVVDTSQRGFTQGLGLQVGGHAALHRSGQQLLSLIAIAGQAGVRVHGGRHGQPRRDRLQLHRGALKRRSARQAAR